MKSSNQKSSTARIASSAPYTEGLYHSGSGAVACRRGRRGTQQALCMVLSTARTPGLEPFWGGQQGQGKHLEQRHDTEGHNLDSGHGGFPFSFSSSKETALMPHA